MKSVFNSVAVYVPASYLVSHGSLQSFLKSLVSSLVGTDEFNIKFFNWDDLFRETIDFLVSEVFDHFLVIPKEILLSIIQFSNGGSFSIHGILNLLNFLEKRLVNQRIFWVIFEELRNNDVGDYFGDVVSYGVSHLTRVWFWRRGDDWWRTSSWERLKNSVSLKGESYHFVSYNFVLVIEELEDLVKDVFMVLLSVVESDEVFSDFGGGLISCWDMGVSINVHHFVGDDCGLDSYQGWMELVVFLKGEVQ